MSISKHYHDERYLFASMFAWELSMIGHLARGDSILMGATQFVNLEMMDSACFHVLILN